MYINRNNAMFALFLGPGCWPIGLHLVALPPSLSYSLKNEAYTDGECVCVCVWSWPFSQSGPMANRPLLHCFASPGTRPLRSNGTTTSAQSIAVCFNLLFFQLLLLLILIPICSCCIVDFGPMPMDLCIIYLFMLGDTRNRKFRNAIGNDMCS